ncbi:unnamed protein product [Blepharisma stoltei]|uniref:Uncharacterized protein n=1 Tax=Blepharisma stoltei TaxID=1481888 RepID=A0AAU9KAA6_9CILI|nr:unnamed protein product [Blepharisma stoltei]
MFSHSSSSQRISDIFSITRTPESELYHEERQILRQHIGRLNRSFDGKEKILKSFEDLLRAVHFFDKPDIIPTPNDMDWIKQQILIRQEDTQESYKRLYEDEKKLRKDEEQDWREKEKKWKYLEKEWEESIKRGKIAENEQRNRRAGEIERENEGLKSMVREMRNKCEELEGINRNMRREQEERDVIIEELKEEVEILRSTVREYRNKYEEECEEMRKLKTGFKEKYLAEELLQAKNKLNALQEEYEFTLNKLKKVESFKEIEGKRDPKDIFELEKRNKELEGRLQILEKAYASQLDINEKKKNEEKIKIEENPEIWIENGLDKNQANQISAKLINPFQKLNSADSLNLEDRLLQTPLSNHSEKDNLKHLFSIKSSHDSTLDPKIHKNLKGESKKFKKSLKHKGSSTNLHTDRSDFSSRRDHIDGSSQMSKTDRKSSRERLTTEKGDFCEVCVKVHGHKWANSPYKEKINN